MTIIKVQYKHRILTEHATCMGQMRNALKHLVRKPKRKKKTAVSLGLDGRIILI